MVVISGLDVCAISIGRPETDITAGFLHFKGGSPKVTSRGIDTFLSCFHGLDDVNIVICSKDRLIHLYPTYVRGVHG